MPRQLQPVEFNTFIGGLVTEASPLTFPPNASLDEENFVLNKDGSRSRRLGIDYEDDYEYISTNYTQNQGTDLATSSYKWPNAGGLSTNTIICVQIGSNIDFFLWTSGSISPNLIYSYTFDGLSESQRVSYATVDGMLIVATGSKDITVFTYDTSKSDPTAAISVETRRLLVRDFFGLDDFTGSGVDLRTGEGVSYRPDRGEVGGQHIYNLRNQGWAAPRTTWVNHDITPVDCIPQFYTPSGDKYPSNADMISQYLYQNTFDSGGISGLYMTLTRFDVQNMWQNPPFNSAAPNGHFIIDVLDRSSSRLGALNSMQLKYPRTNAQLLSLAKQGVIPDSTPSGATVVCEFAGRVFYGGFTGEVIGGDIHSPKLSSYLLFSQLVEDSSTINLCYQEADPTDNKISDLVDTDGGFIRLEGAYGIIGMAVLQGTLFVLAKNGVWTVSGDSGGFSATSYQSNMLTNSGCVSPGSIVVMQDSIFYWGIDGIYSITRNQYGDFKSSNITDKTIKRFFMGISDRSLKRAEGVYDSYSTTVKWVYNNYFGADDDPIELHLDCLTGAYYKLRIAPLTNKVYPLLVKGIQTDAFRVTSSDEDVVVGGNPVITSDGNQVIVSTSTISNSSVKGISYLILSLLSGEVLNQIRYTFGSYTQNFHMDWVSEDPDGVGIDAPAHLITGYLNGGDTQRDKQGIYITVHTKKT